jgi:membrane fusion protein, multidrug efflux system
MTHISRTIDLVDDSGLTGLIPRDIQAPVPTPGLVSRLGWRRLLLAGAALIGVAAAGDLGTRYWTTGRFEVSTDDAYVKADTTVIAPKISGYLSEVLVADNQTVKAGQPLARIDARDYRVAVEQARADLAAARADIDNVNASLGEQQAVIAQAHASVAVDQANVTFAQQDSDRYATLAHTGAGSVQNQQQATTKLQVAQATSQRDEATVLAAERRASMLRAQLAKAEATEAHNQAVLDQAELNLGYTTIVSPVDGVVGNRGLRVGQFVQAGTQLMAVVPIEGVYIVANYKETQLTDVRPGQPATIEVDMFPGTTVKGHVDSIAPASGQEFALLPPDNATGNFTKVVQRIPVKIVLDVNDPLSGMLRPGMSVTPVVDTKSN